MSASERCHGCWNLDSYCTCRVERRAELVGKASLTHDDVARMFDIDPALLPIAPPAPIRWTPPAGYQAGLAGEPLSANPHDLGTAEHRGWTHDHIQGSKRRHSAAGTYGTRAGMHDYRPVHDPAAEILGIDEDMAIVAAPTPVDPTSILDDPPLRFPGEPDPDAPRLKGVFGDRIVFDELHHWPADYLEHRLGSLLAGRSPGRVMRIIGDMS